MIVAKAPGKVILFGEYASLFGYKSIGIAVKKYVKVKISESEKGLKIISEDTKSQIEIKSHEDFKKYSKRFTYVQEAIKYLFKEIPDLEISTSLSFPASSGIGSSSALLVALIGGLLKYLGKKFTVNEVVAIAKKIEEKVKGEKLCYTDFFISAVGGYVVVDNKKASYKKLDLELPLFLRVIKRREIPSRFCLKKIHYFAKFFGWAKACISAIGLLVEEAEKSLNRKDLQSIGNLMTINHYMLKNLYLTTPAIDFAVKTALNKKAYGAKLTGAGGGGSIIYLSDKKIFPDSIYVTPDKNGLIVYEE